MTLLPRQAQGICDALSTYVHFVGTQLRRSISDSWTAIGPTPLGWVVDVHTDETGAEDVIPLLNTLGIPAKSVPESALSHGPGELIIDFSEFLKQEGPRSRSGAFFHLLLVAWSNGHNIRPEGRPYTNGENPLLLTIRSGILVTTRIEDTEQISDLLRVPRTRMTKLPCGLFWSAQFGDVYCGYGLGHEIGPSDDYLQLVREWLYTVNYGQ